MHILVLTQHNVADPRYGGALRVSALAEQLRRNGAHVSVIRFRSADELPSPEGGRFSVRDVIVPPGYAMASVAALYHRISRDADRAACAFHAGESVDLIQSDPPWAALTGQRLAQRLRAPHVVLAHNCESVLAAQFARAGPARRVPLAGRLLSRINLAVLRRAEKRTIESADLTLTPSAHDREEMARIGIATGRVEVLPNGTSVRPVSADVRAAMRAQLDLDPDDPVVVFVGRMDYPPNREAAEIICKDIAPRCPAARFVLVGSHPPAGPKPANVTSTGSVAEVETYLSAGDLAIVPMLRGSGTRIKILDAWAAGLPVLSTSTGASGLGYRNGVDIVIEDDPLRFPARIIELLSAPDRLAHLRCGALQAAVSYRWETIGNRYVGLLRALTLQAASALPTSEMLQSHI